MTAKRTLLIGIVASALVAPWLAGAAVGQGQGPAYSAPRPGFQIRFANVIDGKVDPKKVTATHTINRWDGDTVVYRNRFTASSSGATLVNDSRSWRGVLTYSLHRVGVGVIHDQIDEQALARFWPFTVGKQLTMTSKRYVGEGKTLKAAWEQAKLLRTVVHRWRVLRRETVTVPAGRFETLVVERRWELRTPDGKGVQEAGRRLFWFAPSIGWIVKLDFAITQGEAKGQRSGIEAVSYRQPR